MTIVCPCCNQPLAVRAPVEALEAAPLSGLERRTVSRLAGVYPRGIARDALIEQVYCWPHDEPDNAVATLQVIIHRLRNKLPQYGWSIDRENGGKWSPAIYKLQPIEDLKDAG